MTADPRGPIAEQMAWLLQQFEGGWSNRAADHGGPTSRGMTAAGWHAYAGVWLTPHQLAELPDEALLQGHLDLAAIKTRFDRIADWRPRLVAMDWAIHSGGPTAVRHLQLVLGVDDDGIFGPETSAAVTRVDPVWLAARLVTKREQFLLRFIDRDATQTVFAHGWWTRCATLLETVTAEVRAV